MEAISFWQLINSPSEHKILIPAIQRDYAQGRENSTDDEMDYAVLRSNFLASIKHAIVSGNALTMDFIYGATEDARFIPLDGQQRLTTLWLIHWYAAYRSRRLLKADGTPTEEARLLQRFSYETRTTSTTFCHDLCMLKVPSRHSALREWIVSQTWFYHQYEYDPTIQSMLTMLCGTSPELADGIDMIWDKSTDFNHIWEILTTTRNVGFYRLPIKVDDSDELYIKMNARGRQLTEFENFKAELVEYVKTFDEQWSVDFAGKLDVGWTDIFWGDRFVFESGEISIDQIYFTFLRRYAYNLITLANGNDGDKVADRLYSPTVNIDMFKQALTKDALIALETTLDNLQRSVGEIADIQSVVSSLFAYGILPVYDKSKAKVPEVVGIDKRNRPVFFAVCKYFEYGRYSEDSFRDWLRIVRNVSDNPADTSIYSLLRLFNFMAPHSHYIMSYLRQAKGIKFPNNNVQMHEEQEKARHWDEFGPEILEAERYSFFRGAIRVLFTDERGTTDWRNFATKWRTAKRMFATDASSPLRDASKALRFFIILTEQNLNHFVFDNNDKSWRERVTDSRGIWHSANHRLLMAGKVPDFDAFESTATDPRRKFAIEHMVKTDLYSHIYEGSFLYRHDGYAGGCYYLIPFRCSAERKHYILSPRIDLLYSIPEISFQNEQLNQLRSLNVMPGKNIRFVFEGFNFEWWAFPDATQDDVYLMDTVWGYIHRHPDVLPAEGTPDHQLYYCFRIDLFDPATTMEAKKSLFKDNLRTLIKDFQSQIALAPSV